MKSERSLDAQLANSHLQRNPIAVVGMASVFPEARTLQQYWDNIIHEVDCITDVPASRWSVEDYYDPDPSAPDKTYCRRGGFIPDIDFNPMEFGIPPSILEATDISQLLALVVAKETLEDAGYGEADHLIRERTGVVLGVGVGRQLGTALSARLQYPIWERVLRSSGMSEGDIAVVVENMKLAYVSWQENSFPGALGNVVAGRVANRLNLGGINCVVDAACASSLGAVKLAVSELIEGRSDMMLTGGVDTDNSIMMYMCFSKTPAFSQQDNVRPFDAESDGMMVGEGIGMLALRRLEDAERDSDRIYAVIRGIGTSSDGRYKSIYAPSAEGQVKALQRAYEDAGFSPASIGLIEAHGTGTMAGDPAEVEALNQVFGQGNPARRKIALGSVKSQIGHTKAAAGAASMIKAVLALHHKVLPPTINVTRPNPKLELDSGPFYLNTLTRPWIRVAGSAPRRAGVSSFGFGGTNFHLVLEEYEEEHERPYRLNSTSSQSIVLSAATPEQLLSDCDQAVQRLGSEEADRQFAELAAAGSAREIPPTAARIGFLAETPAKARSLLEIGIETLKQRHAESAWRHPKGIFYRRTGIGPDEKVVALFAGQGSQYVGMGRELALNLPQLRRAYAAIDARYLDDSLEPVSGVVFPIPVFTEEERQAQEEALQRTLYAQPAIAAFSVGLFKILRQAGFQPDFVAGHSFGELTALWAAGVLTEADYFDLVKARGMAMAPPNEPNFDAGTMMAVAGDVERIQEEIRGLPDIRVANLNANNQAVLAGDARAIDRAHSHLTEKGYSVRLLPVSAAFHTPLVGHAQRPFAKAVAAATFAPARVPVYANSTGDPYPTDPQTIQEMLAEHILQPVLFKQQIENLHAAGGRVFVEFGPKSILTNLVRNILGDQPHEAVALNASSSEDSDRQLRQAALHLRVIGLPLDEIDPYRLERRPASSDGQSSMVIRLNSSNYVSEETQAAYETALRDGHRIGAAAGETTMPSGRGPESPATAPSQSTDSRPEISVPAPTQSAERASNSPALAPESSAGGEAAESSASGDAPAALAQQPKPLPAPRSHRLLESLEHGLSQFADHQGETSRLHEQFLQTQMEYSQMYSQLMQEQYALLSNGNAVPEQLEALRELVERLGQSLQDFHRHQDETVRVHERYLTSQAEFSKTFSQLLHQEFASFATDGDSRSVAPDPQDQHGTLASPSAPPRAPQVGQDPRAAAEEPAPARAVGTTPAPDRSPASELPDLAPAEAPARGASSAPVAAPAAGKETAAPPAPVEVDVSAIAAALLRVVSEKTGYPTEVIELEMDLEADLGIDSIKRVEILGAMQERYTQLPKLDPEELAELRSLRQIIDYIQRHLAAGQDTAGEPKPVEALADADRPADPMAPVEGTEAAVGTDRPAAPITPGAGSRSSPGKFSAPASTRRAGVRVQPRAEDAERRQPTLSANSDTEAIAASLLEVVCEKTGYPVEALEPEMELEADLGIDAVTMIEILGTWRESLDLPAGLDLEDLSRRRTLGRVIEELAARTPAAAQIRATNGNQAAAADRTIRRYRVRPKHLPAPDRLDFALAPGHCCVLTDDGGPTTVKVAERLAQRGWPVVVLSFPSADGSEPLPLPEGVARVALSNWSETQLAQQLQTVAGSHGPVAAFIHLNPESTDQSSGEIPFPEAERAIVKHVFLIAKHLKESLTAAAQEGRSCFVTVSRLDGQFGLAQKRSFGAIGAGLPGLTKTLGLEWPAVYCRAIDLSPDLDDEQSAERIVAELHDPNRLLAEVGYDDQARVTLVCEEAGLNPTAPDQANIDASSVFVVSGGAKGITSQCAIALAQHYQCGFILLGRTSIAEPEPDWAAGVDDEAELKRRILEELASQGEQPSPARIQAAYAAIASQREVAATLRAIEAAGGRAHYHSVDITAGPALQAALSAADQDLGPVTGLIHGAGNLADKWIEKKTEGDFELVFSTKVDGLRNLLHSLPIEQLDQVVIFSSTAGFYGNVGQSDYALANEVLNKAAYLIQQRHPTCHTMVINWGPWDGGMVSPELKKIFALRNIEVIPVELGTRMFMDELASPDQATAQVVISSPIRPGALAPGFGEPEPGMGSYRIHRTVSVEANPFLKDHLIGGKPVLPFACAAGWMINASEELYPGHLYFSLNDFRLLNGIVLDATAQRELVLDLKQQSGETPDELELEARIWSEDSPGKTRYHYQGRVKLLRRLPTAPRYETLDLAPAQDLPGRTFYENGTLFHGSSLQGVDRVLNMSPEKLTLRCRLPRVDELTQGQFPIRTFDPFTTDVEFHGALIWTDYFHQEGCLPTRSPRFEQFGAVPFEEAFYVSMEVRSKTETTLVVDVITHDSQGQIYNRLLGFEATVSKRLYRSFT